MRRLVGSPITNQLIIPVPCAHHVHWVDVLETRRPATTAGTVSRSCPAGALLFSASVCRDQVVIVGRVFLQAFAIVCKRRLSASSASFQRSARSFRAETAASASRNLFSARNRAAPPQGPASAVSSISVTSPSLSLSSFMQSRRSPPTPSGPSACQAPVPAVQQSAAALFVKGHGCDLPRRGRACLDQAADAVTAASCLCRVPRRL